MQPKKEGFMEKLENLLLGKKTEIAPILPPTMGIITVFPNRVKSNCVKCGYIPITDMVVKRYDSRRNVLEKICPGCLHTWYEFCSDGTEPTCNYFPGEENKEV